jgi:hypothetical protein
MVLANGTMRVALNSDTFETNASSPRRRPVIEKPRNRMI